MFYKITFQQCGAIYLHWRDDLKPLFKSVSNKCNRKQNSLSVLYFFLLKLKVKTFVRSDHDLHCSLINNGSTVKTERWINPFLEIMLAKEEKMQAFQ